MNYLFEIDSLKKKYTLSAEETFILRILAIVKMYDVDYHVFKKYLIKLRRRK